jgi:hypothetical protein
MQQLVRNLVIILALCLVPAFGQDVVNPGGGSGSGTVSANNGSANTVAGYSSAGGSATVAPFAGLVFVAPSLSIGGPTFGNGQVALFGNTSGSCTNTVNATSTIVTTSCNLTGPSGSTFVISSSSGNAINLTSPGGGSISLTGTVVDTSSLGNLNNFHLFYSTTAPTIAAAGCGGGAASIPSNNGTIAFTVNVGTTPGSACTVTLPTASADWICNASDLTTANTSVFLQKQTGAASTTGATITNFNTAGSATAFVASDVLRVSCFAY